MAKLDPVSQYATDVCNGRIVASRLVRLQCERHNEDVKHQIKRGLKWRPDEAQHVIDFFAEVLCLPEASDGDDGDDEPVRDGQPFVLSPFQQFIAGSLFGWYTVDGYRRFKTAYIETAKGSGKTPFAAGLALYVLVSDGEPGSQIFAAAVGKDQAKLAFTDAENMVAASPYLRELVDSKVNNLSIAGTGSFFRPVSSEKRGLDGKRVRFAIIDEEHEHPTAIVVNKMRAGIKGRRNALIVEITNSGYDRTSVCWNHHVYSRQVLEGTIANDGWFAFVCGLDPCEKCADDGKWFPSEDCPDCDDWKTEGPHWLKANPNLGVSLPWQYLRDRVNQALGMPSEVSDVLRFNFCVWTQGKTAGFSMAKWHQCGRLVVTADDLIGVPGFGGIDLGQTDDFSSFCGKWRLADGRTLAKWRFWIPEAALEKYPNRPYSEWKRAGILTVIAGAEVLSPLEIVDDIFEQAREWGLQEIAYDKTFAQDLAHELEGRGLLMVDTRQGFWLNEALVSIATDVSKGLLAHGNNAIAGWMASNAVFTSSHGRIRLDKETAKDKVDGISALAMAESRLILQPVQRVADDPVLVTA